jgi:iron complex outermembrane receptor protein
VLLDGLRVPPTLLNGVVDVDVIPQMLVQRVDTVTGGVSAVYGSDAVTGVVNYVIDKKFNGLKALAQTGVSERGRRQEGRCRVRGRQAAGRSGPLRGQL